MASRNLFALLASSSDEDDARNSCGEGYGDRVGDDGGNGGGSGGETASVEHSQLHMDAADGAEHPFATEAGDHAETPKAAYQHIAPLLSRLATRLGTTPAELKIYDPCVPSLSLSRAPCSIGPALLFQHTLSPQPVAPVLQRV
jgi:hypothetical protein